MVNCGEREVFLMISDSSGKGMSCERSGSRIGGVLLVKVQVGERISQLALRLFTWLIVSGRYGSHDGW